MTAWSHVPPHVWALVLRDATVHNVFTMAHVCRALHELVTSSAQCTCASAPQGDGRKDGFIARAFWAHWHMERGTTPTAHEWESFVRNGHVAHVRLALLYGVDPSQQDQWAIRTASAKGHLSVVRLLLRDGRVDPGARGHFLPVHHVAKRGRMARCLLRDMPVDPSAQRNLPILAASALGHAKIVRLLLNDARVDPSVNDQEPLRMASRYGHFEVVDCLLDDARVDPSTCDQEAIFWACRNGHLGVIERLLRDDRVDPCSRNGHALKEACRRGHVDIVECLLRDVRVARDVAAIEKCMRVASVCGRHALCELLERYVGTSRVGNESMH